MIITIIFKIIKFFCRTALRFIVATVFRVMGCFLACFRARNDHRSAPRLQGAPESQSRLSSLFLHRDGEYSTCEEKTDFSSGSALIDKELKDEVKFLKACGAIPETPPEIWKGSEKLKSHDVDSDHSSIGSFPSQKLIKKLLMDENPDQPSSPVELYEKDKDFCSPHYAYSRISIGSNNNNNAESVKPSVYFHAHHDENIVIPLSPLNPDTTVQQRSKSVRFVCDVDLTPSSESSSEDNIKDSIGFETPVNQSISKPSTNPTPLKLSDEMLTPGTAYPTTMENSIKGNMRVRSQYVYPLSNPVETSFQWRVLNDLNANSQFLSAELGEFIEQLDRATPESKSIKDANTQWSGAVSARDSPFDGTTGDMLVTGNVAAHWIEDETFKELPMWSDGNGIPNSTHKYKEDQKVSWHATPFEERLEKALSNGIPIPQRKPIVRTSIPFEENVENETKLSLLDSAAQSKPAASC